MIKIPENLILNDYKLHNEIIPNSNIREINNKLNEISKKYSNENKVLVFLIIDYEFKINIPKNIFLLRTSLRKSMKSPKEYVLPYIWETLDKPYKPLKKTPRPIVGFCGQVNKFRKNILNKIYLNKYIEDNFILNKHFWGGLYVEDTLDKKKIVEDFQNNMKNSHFIICNRGAGNFTMRFYQTLAAGRIPVLVNTDMVLPLEDIIPWKKFIIIEPTDELVIEKILLFWQYKDIKRAQKVCAQVFNNYFSHKNFNNFLKPILN